jgi:hypothetical protein
VDREAELIRSLKEKEAARKKLQQLQQLAQASAPGTGRRAKKASKEKEKAAAASGAGDDGDGDGDGCAARAAGSSKPKYTPRQLELQAKLLALRGDARSALMDLARPKSTARPKPNAFRSLITALEEMGILKQQSKSGKTYIYRVMSYNSRTAYCRGQKPPGHGHHERSSPAYSHANPHQHVSLEPYHFAYSCSITLIAGTSHTPMWHSFGSLSKRKACRPLNWRSSPRSNCELF